MITAINLTQSEIIEELIREHKIPHAELAIAIGVNRTTIDRITNGGIKKIKEKLLIKIADYFSISVEQLKGEKPIILSNKIITNQELSMVPLYFGAFNGKWDFYFTKSNTPIYVSTDKIVSERCFALNMEDDSMSPIIAEKSKVICDPDLKMESYTYVVVKPKKSNFIMIRQYINDSDFEYLKPCNILKYEIYPLSNEDVYLGRIIEIKTNFI